MFIIFFFKLSLWIILYQQSIKILHTFTVILGYFGSLLYFDKVIIEGLVLIECSLSHIAYYLNSLSRDCRRMKLSEGPIKKLLNYILHVCIEYQRQER